MASGHQFGTRVPSGIIRRPAGHPPRHGAHGHGAAGRRDRGPPRLGGGCRGADRGCDVAAQLKMRYLLKAKTAPATNATIKGIIIASYASSAGLALRPASKQARANMKIANAAAM